MLPRFFVPDLDPSARETPLPAAEAHHLSRVLRLRPDDEVRVFDGRGLEFLARVSAVDRDAAAVTLLERIEHAWEPRVRLTLVQSVLKGPSMDDVVRDCTMAGIDTIQPVVSARTTVKVSTVSAAGERWGRVALAATKQCGRPRLPHIRALMRFDDWVRGVRSGPVFILLEPSAAAAGMRTLRMLAREPAPSAASVVVGPEGGWTVEERELAIAAGCTPLSLGGLTLRADAVPLAAAVALIGVWDDGETASTFSAPRRPTSPPPPRSRPDRSRR